MSRNNIGRPMEILLVEDSLTHAAMTIEALKQGMVRHRLTLVVDGVEAMEFLRREGKFGRAPHPDLVLLDLELPRKDGREVLTDMKADTTLEHIPVVILTSSDDPDDVAQAQMLGVDSYITKPVDREKFLNVVRQLKSHWHADLVLPPM
ncbi:MAG: response regulator [Pirellulales bacterium]